MNHFQVIMSLWWRLVSGFLANDIQELVNDIRGGGNSLVARCHATATWAGIALASRESSLRSDSPSHSLRD
ncbi:MAG: hypothetical protein ACE15E_02755 [Acidobacteriota bacterium]